MSVQISDKFVKLCIDMCMDMCTNMCINMCIDMCTNMCTDMCMDMCIDMCVQASFCRRQTFAKFVELLSWVAEHADFCAVNRLKLHTNFTSSLPVLLIELLRIGWFLPTHRNFCVVLVVLVSKLTEVTL